jgi:hypothetical protein
MTADDSPEAGGTQVSAPGRCRECHRKLRDPAWAARRIGRVCAEKLGLVAARRPGPVAVAVAPKAAPKAENGDGQMTIFEIEWKGVA